MVVFWNESLGRQLITPENEGGDGTNYPSPPTFSFFDDPDVPFGPGGPLARPEPHEPPEVLLAYHQDGLQLHHLLVVEKEWELEIHRVIGCIRDLHRPSLNLFQFK